MKRPAIFNDEIFLGCLGMARQSKADYRTNQAYGSYLVKDGQVIGKGFNRAIVHKHFRLERIIRQGYSNHAEIEALNDALLNGKDTNGGEIYVAGFFVRSKQIFFHEDFTCLKCANCLNQYGIKNINIPLPGGWQTRPIETAINDARNIQDNKYEYRKQTTVGNFLLTQI